MLRIQNLHLHKEGFSLENISFEVPTNSYFVILGKTGSGKTMLLESIAGIQEVAGQLYWDDEEITELPPQKRGFGFVYQDFALFPNLSVRKNITYSGRFAKRDDAARLLRIWWSFCR
jgi:molybdate/tungstate transport system ATP-binding protein